MRFFLIWFFLSLVAAVIAHGKGRSALLYFFVSMIFSPVIGVSAALLVSTNAPRASKKCARCGALARTSALKCGACGRAFPDIIDAEVIGEKYEPR